MSFTKPQIYNLALSALLLSREIKDVITDKSEEVRVLNTHFDLAFQSTLEDLDLDSTSQRITLELIETLDSSEYFIHVYRYPDNCVFLRRIKSSAVLDNQDTHIPKVITLRDGIKVILTNAVEAVIECIPKDVPLATLAPNTVLAVAYKMAYMAAPLLAGKGSRKLRETIMADYILAKTDAQKKDHLENFNYESDYLRSEFVSARLE